MNDFIKTRKALADPKRVKIVNALRFRSMCVCNMLTALEPAQPKAPRHLKILVDARSVASKRPGLWVNDSPADDDTAPCPTTLAGNVEGWLEDDTEVLHRIGSLPSIWREVAFKK